MNANAADGQRPAGRHIAGTLRPATGSGELPPGARLLSGRQPATDRDAARNTVREAACRPTGTGRRLPVLHASTGQDGSPHELTRFAMRAGLAGLPYDTPAQ